MLGVICEIGMVIITNNYKVHSKTVRYGLLAWTRVSANSEQGIGTQWAVRVGQRLQSRFGESGVGSGTNRRRSVGNYPFAVACKSQFRTLFFLPHHSSLPCVLFCSIKVGLGISRTNVDSQWNPVYNAFHRIFCCGHETICR